MVAEKAILIMYLAMNAYIYFPATERRDELRISPISGFEVSSSLENLTDKAELTLPRAVKEFKSNSVGDLIRRGDPIEIMAGYNGSYQEEFKGWVTAVNSEAPVVISCEDNMFKLKSITKSVSIENVKLNELLKLIVPDEYNIDALDVRIGEFAIKKTTVASILNELKSRLGLYSYFKGDTLVCGKIYSDDIESGELISYVFEQEIKEHSLKYLRAEDRLIQIEAKSIDSSGESISVKAGDNEGDSYSLSYFGVESETDLLALATEDLKKYKVDGFKGDFKVSALKRIRHGILVELISQQYPEKNGRYFAKAVKTIFNDSPVFERSITLGPKAS